MLEWLSTEPRFFERLADGPVLMPRARPAIETGVRVTSLIEKPPDGAVDVDPGEAVERSARFYRTDFVRRDPENRQLGRLGEEWVVEFEQRRLHDEERRPDLARRVEVARRMPRRCPRRLLGAVLRNSYLTSVARKATLYM